MPLEWKSSYARRIDLKIVVTDPGYSIFAFVASMIVDIPNVKGKDYSMVMFDLSRPMSVRGDGNGDTTATWQYGCGSRVLEAGCRPF